MRNPAPGGDPARYTTLGYLNPEHLRLGSVGVFAGDWAYHDGRIPIGFVGVLIDRWNGWAVWSCTKDVAEAVVADQQRLQKTERLRARRGGATRRQSRKHLDQTLPYLYFDGDDVVVDERDQDGRSRVCPDTDGQYVINGWAWTWTAVEPADCDSIAGQIPPYGRHQVYEILPHTGLQVPHRRIAITAPASPHPAHHPAIAELTLDGRPAATIHQATLRAYTVPRPNTDQFTTADWFAYVEACRDRGQPVGEERVIDALLVEAHTEHVIAEADAMFRRGLLGRRPTVYRLVDHDQRPIITFADAPLPADATARSRLAEQLSSHDAARRSHPDALRWQYWSGRHWQHLAYVPTPPTTL